MQPWSSGVVLALAVLLAGCGESSPGTPSPSPSSGSTSPNEDMPSATPADLPERNGTFAVLVFEGVLSGEGPQPEHRVACSIARPNGRLDLVAHQAWARPSSHSFSNGTWLVIADKVRVDDPRGGCLVPLKATPFATVGEWTPQMDSPPMHLGVSDSGSDLLISKLPLAPRASVQEHLEFQDGAYTFSGNLTFTHTGWWPRSAFSERDDGIAPEADGAAWWG